MTKSEREQALGSMRVGPLLVRMALPATVAMLIGATYNPVDAIFVGRGVDSLAIGALALAFPVQRIVIATGNMLGFGATSVFSRSLGAGNREKARRTAGTTFVVAVLVGLAVATFVTVTLKPLLSLLGASWCLWRGCTWGSSLWARRSPCSPSPAAS